MCRSRRRREGGCGQRMVESAAVCCCSAVGLRTACSVQSPEPVRAVSEADAYAVDKCFDEM